MTEPTPSSEPTASGDSHYVVGYGKPPKATQFQPGQSGNPKGRPKGAKSLNKLLLETLGASISVRTANGTRRITRIEAVLQKTLEQAMKGNGRAQLELIKLWRGAVPEQPVVEEGQDSAEGLTATDLAMLDEFRANPGGEQAP